ncbi:MAG: hypothetical protein Q7R95_11310 [bacterium]|nr:hypothetical protein [bacterium]
MQRYVRKDRRIYDFSTCNLCGDAYGVIKPEIQHRATTCLLCGTRQCMGNGLGNGCCSICYHGLLPGWSGSEGICSYKNCGKVAVARGKQGKRYVCLEHAFKQFGNDVIERAKIDLLKSWVLVEESPNSPY